MSYKTDLPLELIQGVRAAQALMEDGYTIAIDEKWAYIFEYLAKCGFTVSLTTNIAEDELDIKLSHDVPYVTLLGVERRLLYSKELFAKSKLLWTEKTAQWLCRAYPTAERLEVCAAWMRQTGITPTVRMENFNRANGIEKYWDESYYRDLAKYEFLLCPNGLDHQPDGAHVWTYRFFDAILCGTIPVIQAHAPAYEGFEYYLMSDTDITYSKGMAERNFNKLKEMVTL